MKLERGSKLGPYEILAPLGAGGMGEVYRARDPQLGRDIAVKVLPENVSYRKERLARFENEARLASSLNHPNIVTIHSMGWENERCYIAMELIEGLTLQEMMNDGAIAVDRALNIFAQVADGLARAHEAGIIHRDLKPKNIMVTRDGHAKILDFGLSKLTRSHVDSEAPTATSVAKTDPSESLTKPGAVLGTVEYMSPEQAAGRSVDFRSDQFSMGSLMYAVLTGNLPFHRESEIQTLNQIIEGEPRPLDKLNPRVPAALQEILRRCLLKDPGDRYASTRELSEELKKLELEGKVLLRRWTRRDWVRASVGLMILLVVAAVIWIWSRLPYSPKREAVDWYQEGMAAMHSMNYDSARKFLTKAVEIDPQFVLAQANLSRAYDEMDYSENATQQMLRASVVGRNINLSRLDEKRLLVLQYIVSHDFDSAVGLVHQLEEEVKKEDRAAAALESGWLAEKREDTESAADAYERALKINPDYAAARLRLGFIRQRRVEDIQALQDFAKAEELYDLSNSYEGKTESLYQQANLMVRRNRSEEAMNLIEKAIDTTHTTNNQYQEIRLMILKSTALRKLRDIFQAREIAQKAVEAAQSQGMDNLEASGMIALGNTFFDVGDFDSAEKNFRKALEKARMAKVKHYQALALLSLGSLFEQKNRPEDARKQIEEAAPLFEEAGYRRESVQAEAVLGGILCQLGMYDKGIDILREALPRAILFRDSVTEARIRERLVEILQARGNWPEALKESEEAASKFAAREEGIYARLNCAGLYWCLGRWQESEVSLEEVKQQLGDNAEPYALSLLRLRQAEMSYSRGLFDRAAADAQKAISGIPGSGDLAELDAKLIEALSLIRKSRGIEGKQTARQLVINFEESRLVGKTASAQLAIAEALAEVGDQETAHTLASDALPFFQQHGVWESAWRAHLVAARASEEAADISIHIKAARADFAKLRELWPANDLERYLQRPDIKLISGNLSF